MEWSIFWASTVATMRPTPDHKRHLLTVIWSMDNMWTLCSCQNEGLEITVCQWGPCITAAFKCLNMVFNLCTLVPEVHYFTSYSGGNFAIRQRTDWFLVRRSPSIRLFQRFKLSLFAQTLATLFFELVHLNKWCGFCWTNLPFCCFDCCTEVNSIVSVQFKHYDKFIREIRRYEIFKCTI